MRVIDKIVFAVMVACMVSCGPCKHMNTHTESNVSDSTSVSNNNTHIIKDSVSVKDTTAHVPLPVESSQSTAPVFLPSHLETSLAVSDAYVDSLGLHHTLENKKGSFEVNVPVTEHHHYESHNQQTDSTSFHSDSQKETVTEYVEKQLTKWQKFRLNAFWWLVLGILASLVVIFRKQIFKIWNR